MSMANITLMCPYVRSRTVTAILRGARVARYKEYGMVMPYVSWIGPGDDESDDEE